MDLMDDEDMKKSVIDQMMGELDDVTAGSLKKPVGPVKGVEISITVTPKSGEEEEAPEEMAEAKPEDEEEEPEGDYINQLLKKLG